MPAGQKQLLSERGTRRVCSQLYLQSVCLPQHLIPQGEPRGDTRNTTGVGIWVQTARNAKKEGDPFCTGWSVPRAFELEGSLQNPVGFRCSALPKERYFWRGSAVGGGWQVMCIGKFIQNFPNNIWNSVEPHSSILYLSHYNSHIHIYMQQIDAAYTHLYSIRICMLGTSNPVPYPSQGKKKKAENHIVDARGINILEKIFQSLLAISFCAGAEGIRPLRER